MTNITLQDFICENHKRLYNFVYGQLKNQYDAEDAVSQIIITAINQYSKLKDESKKMSWLFGIARNIIRRYQYKANVPIPLLEDFKIVDTETVPMLETIVQAEEFCNIRKALSSLAKDYRTVMIERYIKEKSYNQISGELSIPVSLVSYRINEGKRILKEEYFKMNTYMNNGYYEPRDMQIDIRYCGKGNEHNKSYRAMDSLLAKNIALVCYDEPLTVTDISRVIGVPADYIEDTITKMLHGKCLIQKSNRYQTAFPIITAEILKRIKAIVLENSEDNYRLILSGIKELCPQIKSIISNEKQAAYFLWDAMSFAGYGSPYDSGFEYPCKENDDNWVVKGYMPCSEEVRFPINKWIVDGLVENEEAVMGFHFNFDNNPLWSDIANNPACRKIIFDISNGGNADPSEAVELLQKAGILDESMKISCLLFKSMLDLMKMESISNPAAKLEYDIISSSKESIIKEVKKLFAKRFDNLEPYINCEIRNFILIGFEEFLLRINAFESVPYIVIKKNIIKHSNGKTKMY